MKHLIPKLQDTDQSRILRNGTFWNLCASLLNSLMTAFILFFVMRLNGVEDAGLFSIAAALAYQALTVGLFGVRNYQVADVKGYFDFSDYFYLRVFTALLMYAVVVYYAFCQGYSLEKASVIFSFSLFKSIDALEDLYHGEYQRQGRLDLASYIQTIRYGLSLTLLVTILFATHNLSLTCLITSAFSLGVFILQNTVLIRHFTKKCRKMRVLEIKNLFLATLPLCLSTWLNIYILNAAKYSIDKVLSSEVQAYFGILVLPVFTINLLATVIYRPYITGLAMDWKNGRPWNFLKGCLRQLAVITGLTILIIRMDSWFTSSFAAVWHAAGFIYGSLPHPSCGWWIKYFCCLYDSSINNTGETKHDFCGICPELFVLPFLQLSDRVEVWSDWRQLGIFCSISYFMYFLQRGLCRCIP